ncbi:MAG TPA: STAS domain-containing protein [Herpetosiphonaceae bacterium]
MDQSPPPADAAASSLWNDERQRRLTILQIINAVGVVASGTLLVLLLTFFTSSATRDSLLWSIAALLALIAGSWILARAGKLEPATHALFGGVLVTMTLAGLVHGAGSSAPYVLFIPIVGATLLLAPRWSYVYGALAYLSSLIMYFGGEHSPLFSNILFRFITFAIYYGVVAVLAYLAAQGHARLISSLLGRTGELEQARAGLEDRVRERTREMQEALDRLRRSSATIREMTVPVLPVAAGVLALPLVGAIDEERAQLIRDDLLASVHRQRARLVLLDVTGVAGIDTYVASVLMELIKSVRLLGAETVLVGMRAESAHAVASLGLDFRSVVTRRDLQSGLEYALRGEGRAS